MHGIRVGSIVRHKAWGVGKVLFVTDTKATVGFPSCRSDNDHGVRDVSLKGTFLETATADEVPAAGEWNLQLDPNGKVISKSRRTTKRTT